MDDIDIAQREREMFFNACLSVFTVSPDTGKQTKNCKGQVICANCGKPIPKKRILAIPTAIYCITCQQEYEEGNL